MDYYGLYPKFKINRLLNESERNLQLHQKQAFHFTNEQTIVSDVSVIKMNSTYLEMVDKYYGQKGFSSIFVGFSICLLIYGVISISYIIVNRGCFYWGDVGLFLTVVGSFIPIALFLLKLLKTEWFAWTHYPIRFNRKEQLVHVHRLNGTVFTVPWDKVFFTTGLSHSKGPTKAWYISGHVLADDGITVTETFCLPASHLIREELFRHWEFIRRYMEEGPEAVADAVDICMPVDGRREGYTFGLLRLLMNFSGSTIFLFPLTFPVCLVLSVSRYIAMLTSKIPTWPQEVEALCRIDPDDPVNLSAATNSRHLWRDLFTNPPRHVY
ncbi:DUF6708 domain-containing protein [Enterobacter sp. KBR-315C3_2022]|jgi:hypothetical protein|uniref:DUF6708 domain-containing protein n=1 Tax=Enterobacter sp. KBR-315C3_2022 TaxID=3242494 RepID=UPI003527CBC7